MVMTDKEKLIDDAIQEVIEHTRISEIREPGYKGELEIYNKEELRDNIRELMEEYAEQTEEDEND